MFVKLTETDGLPNVLDWTMPYGLSPSFLYWFSHDNAIAPPKQCPIPVSISR